MAGPGHSGDRAAAKFGRLPGGRSRSTGRKTRQRPKLHRTYTYVEAAALLGLHPNTVAGWVKSGGLPALTERRPHLIRGADLRAWLAVGRRRKERLQPGEMYCFGCKAPRRPAGGLVDISSNAGAPNFCGICPDCDRLMYRRVARNALDDFRRAAGLSR